jgi:hypothetical protein
VEFGSAKLVREFTFKTDTILEIIGRYQEKGWPVDIAYAVFTYDDSMYPRDIELYQYALELSCPVMLVKTIYEDRYSKPATNADLLLFRKLIDTGHIDLVREYGKIQLSRRPDRDMYEFCLEHGISPVGDIIPLLAQLNPSQYEKVINQYQKAGRHPDSDSNSEFYSFLILTRPDLVPTDCINEDVLDSVLFHGSLELIHNLLDQGFSWKDKQYKIYVPCQDCYNGELHDCNWRYVSANFVSLRRTGQPLSSLNTATVAETFWCTYRHFDGPANDNELYIDDGHDVHHGTRYRRLSDCPPIKIQRPTTGQPAKEMTNHIPRYFVPLWQS